MELVRIFDRPKANLFAIQFDGEEMDEFHRNFDNWNDAEYLFEFFHTHQKDLDYYKIRPDQAAKKTFALASELEELVRKASIHGSANIANSLQTIFNPLDNTETSVDVEHQRTKARKRWLRLYAVRIGPNCFVISGGAIKLTLRMDDREHTRKELRKINRVIDFLKEANLFDENDFEILEL